MVSQLSVSHVRRYMPASRVFGLVAIIIGVSGGAYLAGSQHGRVPDVVERPRAFVAEFNTVEIPVPQKPIPAGMALRDVAFRYEKFPEHQLPQGAVRDVGTVRDMVAMVPLPGGLPVIDSNIGSPDDTNNPVVGRIPPGMRAMTVRVDATSAVEGWARSGSIVDVLLVESSRTTVVAEQVKVLSTEGSLSPVGLEGSSTAPTTVTILVTQEQCLAINTAVPLGKIALVLRGSRDGDAWRATHLSARDLVGDSSTKQKSRVQGVAWFGSGSARHKYALVDDEWIPASALPAGFSPDDAVHAKEK